MIVLGRAMPSQRQTNGNIGIAREIEINEQRVGRHVNPEPASGLDFVGIGR